MRRAVWGCLCLAALLAPAGCSGGGEADPWAEAEGRPIPDAVREELVRLGREDQEAREGLSPERTADTAFAGRMLRGDSARTARLQAIVEVHGWPDSTRAGPEAAQAAFLILQHSPVHAFQQEMLPLLEDLAMQDAVRREQVALLVDRVLMHDGLPQRYGTQFTMVEGRLVLHPVENEAALEERRESMGLPGMEEYMRMLEEAYGATVAREP